MATVIANITGTATGKAKADRVGHWSADLQLVDDNRKPDPRPAARKYLLGELDGATHNQAALEAVRQTLSAMKRDGVCISIRTTNDYLIGVLARHWQPSRNQKLIAEVKALLEKHSVTFEKSA